MSIRWLHAGNPSGRVAIRRGFAHVILVRPAVVGRPRSPVRAVTRNVVRSSRAAAAAIRARVRNLAVPITIDLPQTSVIRGGIVPSRSAIEARLRVRNRHSCWAGRVRATSAQPVFRGLSARYRAGRHGSENAHQNSRENGIQHGL